MSDQVAQPVSGQAVGTAAAQVSAEVQSQSAVETKQEPASQNETVEAQPVTAKDLLALEERMSKQIQSQVDKSSTRVQKRLAEIDQAVAVMRKGGREITDADVKTLKQNAAAEAMIEAEQAEVPEGGSQPDPLDMQSLDPSDPVVRKVIELQLQYGMEIKSHMPQAAKIERGKGAVAFVKSYEAALKEAIGQQSASKEEPKPTTPPAARIPASGGAGGTPAKSGRELLGRAHKED